MGKGVIQKRDIPLGKPDIEPNDLTLVNDVIQSGMLVQGKMVSAFEENAKKWTDTAYCKACSSGTAALHLALLALDIGKGDEVIVPAFSFVASANAILLVGATPVFVDTHAGTYCIDTNELASRITPRTAAIMPVHEFGLCANMPAIMDIAERHDLAVIEDAACAFGARIGDQSAGSWGVLNCFSLHPRKIITSGEGGLVTTDSFDLSEKVSRLRNHGMSIEDGKLEFTDLGLNYRLTDIQAALVVSQLNRLDGRLARHQEIAMTYMNGINNEKIILPIVPEGYFHTWQTFHVVLNEDLDRDDAIDTLRSKGIGCNLGAQCIPATRYYQDQFNYNCALEFPNALRAYKQGLALPLHTHMSDEDIDYVIDAINHL